MLPLLFACTTTVNDTTEPEPAVEPSPYIYDEGETEVPSLEIAEVEATLTEVLDLLPELSARPVVDAYSVAMTGQQSDCPDYYSGDDGSVYWYDYCTADDGTYFTGYGFNYVYVDTPSDGYLYNGEQVFTVSEITTPDGYTFTGGGSASDLIAHSDETAEIPHTIYQSALQGAFSYDGPEAEGTWLASGVTPDLQMVAYDVPPNDVYPGYDGRVLVAVGSVSGLSGQISAVVFTDFGITSGLYTSCDLEPGGEVSVRDGDGLWYDVLFDGPTPFTEEVTDPADCDGCGTVYFRGQELGQACIDATVLTAWEVSPW